MSGTLILIDTHAVIWLYARDLRQFPGPIRQRLDEEQLGLSPFVELEIDFLHELGRFSYPSAVVAEELRLTMELTALDVSAGAVCRAATALTWTRDPFDRLLAAHATVAQLPLVTKDRNIRQHLPLAWWAD